LYYLIYDYFHIRLLGDFLMVLEINIVSSCFKYLTLYLYSLRNKIQKLSNNNIEVLNFRVRVSIFQQIYEVPELESIIKFDLETALKDSNINFQERRSINSKFSLQVKEEQKGNEIQELELIVNEYEEYMAYPHELMILTFFEYYKKHRETMRELFENEEIFSVNIKYYFAIMVRTYLQLISFFNILGCFIC
jgi:hypothetical protein